MTLCHVRQPLSRSRSIGCPDHPFAKYLRHPSDAYASCEYRLIIFIIYSFFFVFIYLIVYALCSVLYCVIYFFFNFVVYALSGHFVVLIRVGLRDLSMRVCYVCMHSDVMGIFDLFRGAIL